MTANPRLVQVSPEMGALDALTSKAAPEPVPNLRPVHGYPRPVHALSPAGTGPIPARDVPISIRDTLQAPLQHPVQAPLQGCPQTPLREPAGEDASKQLAAAVTAALAPADTGRYRLAVTPTPLHVLATVTPPAGSDPVRLAEVLRELLTLRGLGRWRAFVRLRPAEILLIRRVEVAPD